MKKFGRQKTGPRSTATRYRGGHTPFVHDLETKMVNDGMMEGMGVGDSIFVTGVRSTGTDDDLRGFLATFHGHHIIQHRHTKALNEWKLLDKFVQSIQLTGVF